ncbi:hypothetical protein F4805DRAFT_416871 [Annulohypoxylon moriforme]|nr:hypothetical protein F4805DRAFT_416871 [Annulohypoxylon moriforme]
MPPAPTSQSSAAIAGDGKSANNSSGNEYEEALERLQPLQPVLRGLNHRNRGQHRRAAWWAPFGMLRRHIDKLVDELLDSSAAAAAKLKLKSKKRKRGGDDETDDRAERKTRDHVRWLRDVLVPKCYLAFSQLTADNQFATLGVVLLSALAQLNAVCARLIGEVAAAGGEENGGVSSVRELVDNTKIVKEPSNSTNKNQNSEMSSQKGGAVISRDEVARAEKLRKKSALPKEERQVELSHIPSSARKNTDHNDDITSTEKQCVKISKSKTRETNDTSSKEGSKPAKKKRKAKKGDEFDNLFKGLF